MERVYVGNLPPDIRIKDIDDFFRPFGKLVAIDVNNRGNPAFAFVQFDSTRNALSAVRNRHGYDYEGYTLQVKLVDNNVGTGNFEVRNQRRQITPPPPPPLFNNDFNNQMSGGFGNNNNANNFGRGNSGGGNSNFGGGNRNFGGNNFGSNNSNFGSNNSNFGSNNSNFGANNSNFGANNSNFGSNNLGNFGNDNFSSSSSSFQRNTSSQNMIQYPNTNVRSIMPAQNNMIEYPNNNVWNNGSGANSNRNSNRGGGGGGNFSNMGNDFNNMGGGGGDYVYNPNNNCYADNDFEDRFTQGLSGSGRKWFNRYIRKGLTPKIAREKALEHRTLPYLREGGRNQTPNNAVPNLPLPALENFGNKIMSLFSGNNAGGNFGGGGNANQMMSNFNNWGNNNNMQRGGGGGFSNDFNRAGPSSSNNRSGNRDEIRSLVPMRGGAAAGNRGGRPDAGRGAEPGILEKMLAEIPTLNQQNEIASEQYNKSLDILKKLEDKESKVGLDWQDVRDKKFNKQFIKEYRIWMNKQVAMPLSEGMKSFLTTNRTTKELQQLYQRHKQTFLEEAEKANPNGPPKKFDTSFKNRLAILHEQVGITYRSEAVNLATLPREKLDVLVLLSTEYKMKTGKNINDKMYPNERQEERAKKRKTLLLQRTAVKYLKQFEEHDLNTLTKMEKTFLRICLKRKQHMDEEQGLPLATTRFDYLLNDTENDSKTDADVGKTNENQEDNKEDEDDHKDGDTIEDYQFEYDFNEFVDGLDDLFKNDKDAKEDYPRENKNANEATEKQKQFSDKSPKQLYQLYHESKHKMLEELRRRTNPDGPTRRLSTSGKKRRELLKEHLGITDTWEAKNLGLLHKDKLDILFELGAEFKEKTGKCINDNDYLDENMQETPSSRAITSQYRSALQYLKKFEDRDLDTLNQRERDLMRRNLRIKQSFEKDLGYPETTTRFDYLLTVNENELKKNPRGVKDEKNMETEENSDVALKKKTGKCIYDNDHVDEKMQKTSSSRAITAQYRNAVKYLKKFEAHDLDTLTLREKLLLRKNLRTKLSIEKDRGYPETTTRFDYLLTIKLKKNSKEENSDVALKKKTGKCINDDDYNDEKMQEETPSSRAITLQYRNALKYLKKFEDHDLDTLTRREKVLLRRNLRKKQSIEKDRGYPETTTRFDYLLIVNENKLKENPKAVKDEENMESEENSDVAFKEKTGKCINDNDNVDEKKKKTPTGRKICSQYKSAVKYLKSFEEHDLNTLNRREKVFLRRNLRRKQRIEKDRGMPLATTRFDYLLIEYENELKENSEAVKDNEENEEEKIENEAGNIKNKEENIENEKENIENEQENIENVDVAEATENQGEDIEDGNNDITKDENQDEKIAEIIKEQNDQDDEEMPEQQNDN